MATATVGVLLKFDPEELAAIDRARGAEPRTKFIKRFMAAVVRRIEQEGAGHGGG